MKSKLKQLKFLVFCISLIVLNVSIKAQQNKLYVMYVNGSDLLKTFEGDKDSVIAARFKTDDGQNFFPEFFIFKKGNSDPFVPITYIKKLPIPPISLDTFSYAFQTLKWKYKETPTDIINANEIYLITPEIFDNGGIVYYVIDFKKIYDKIPVKNKAFEIVWKAFLDMSEDKRKEILKKVIKILAKNGKFNPIPPQLVP